MELGDMVKNVTEDKLYIIVGTAPGDKYHPENFIKIIDVTTGRVHPVDNSLFYKSRDFELVSKKKDIENEK
jgi:hypothetical protein